MKNLLRKLGTKLGLPAIALAAILNTSCPNMPNPILNVTRSEDTIFHSVWVFNTYQGENENDLWIQIEEKEASFELNPGQSYNFEGRIYSMFQVYNSKEKYYVWAEQGKTYNIDFTFEGVPP